MADATTTNYTFTLPEVGASEDSWGTKLNANWTALDTLLGGTNATEFAILDGATVTTAELNILDGVTATTAELNILDGATVTVSELNILDGLTGVTGSDVSIVTGTAGTENYTAKWNADGDLVDGFEVVGSGDIASDSASEITSSQWVRTYVGATATSATTSGTAIDFTSLRAGIDCIEIIFDEVSLSGTDNYLVQIGTGGSPTTSGYASACSAMGSGVSTFTSTAGMIVFSASATALTSGLMRLSRVPGTNTWVSASNAYASTPAMRVGSGTVTLAGELDNLRLTRTGSNTFDGGSVSIRYR